MVNIKVNRARVLLTNGTDTVFLCPFTKDGLPSQPNLELQFKATYDTGIEYCRRVFGIEPDVINLR